MVASDGMPPNNRLQRTVRLAGRRCTGALSHLCEVRKRIVILRLRAAHHNGEVT